MNAYIVAATRTAIGSFNGSLKDLEPSKLGSIVIKSALEKAKLYDKKELIDEVFLGSILQAGHGQGIARQSSVLAGIPVEVPATTVNILCGSGLYSVILAARAIKAGDGHFYVAGGTESMSQAPFLLKKARAGYNLGHGELIDSMIKDGLWDYFNDYHMGITAENLAEKYNISREEMDEFAFISQLKASNANKEGKFKDEITPVEIKLKKENKIFDKDEYIRENAKLEDMQKLRPAFKKDGKVTAGNSSGINDGASALVIVSEQFLKEHNLKPLVKIVSYDAAGVDPSLMGIGPVPATKNALKKANLSIENIDLVEANEAFAAQSLAVLRELNFNKDIVNVNGGAIALGHPIGASGARILTSLIYEMKKRDSKKGLATLCVGGGMGVSMIVENV